MTDEDLGADSEIQLIGDENGVAIIGNQNAVERFLDSKGLLAFSEKLSLHMFGSMLNTASGITQQISESVENSGRYVKLTKESAKLREELGLMPTKKKGISHLMLGQPGEISKWLQSDDRSAALLTNPAILTGAASLLSQAARQQEIKELKEMLVRIDHKLDDVRRGQRDAVLAKTDRVSLAIRQAMSIREHGGDTETAWGKVEAEAATIGEVQGSALREIQALADKVVLETSVRALSKTAHEIEQETGVWLAVLARCFELQNEFEILELDHVAQANPDLLDGHRLGLNEDHAKRREAISQKTALLMERMNLAGDVAASNILLHARAARKTIASINEVSIAVDGFHAPLGIGGESQLLEALSWKESIRDREQLRTAGREASQKAAIGAGALVIGTLSLLTVKRKVDEET